MELQLIFAISIIGLLFAVYLIRDVLKRDTGSEKMQEISNAIKEGAEAFLRRQNKTILYMAIALAAFIYIMYAIFRTPTANDPASPSQLALWTTISFIFGALCSVAAGYMGMWVAIRSNIRTASAAMKGMNG
ncbi:MAG TPA: sodium/proton-translocating pyrophosphatase, partial [Ignavibacteriaceae bacterium]|nr:sodium/proton-translocating pyrophosphatase [Ignavibacteriaceae bacterium]